MLRRLKYKFLNLTLKRKLVYLTAVIVTIIPIILIGVLASVYYYLGIESLFNNQVSKAISDTVNIAKLYLKENNESIKFDLLQVEKVIDKQIKIIDDSSELNFILNEQVRTRALSEAMIFTRKSIIAKSALSFSFIFQKIPSEVFKEVNEEKVVLLESKDKDKVKAIMKLSSFYYDDVYLIIGKYVDKEIINYLKETQGSAKKYQYLLSEIRFTKQNLQVVFIILSVFMCFFSFLMSIKLANIIISPLNRLLDATSKIKQGDYSTRVLENKSKDEVSLLGKAFNKMTETIERQHSELKIAYRNIDERVNFIETVLKEISSGVVALNNECYITLYNNAAKKLLFSHEKLYQKKIFEIIPEIKPLIEKILDKPKSLFQDNVIVKRRGRKIHIFIRIVAVIIDEKISNIIISFEDITELLSAQREAAWSDVAKRIAHEIKNPLTPIQLSAERLKSKYQTQIHEDDLGSYKEYINIIIRNIDDIHSIVSEFIQFARIPRAKLGDYDIVKIVKDIIFSQKNIYKNIQYVFEHTDRSYNVVCDKIQITQVITNIAKNAAESVDAKYAKNKNLGVIKFIIKEFAADKLEISIENNGATIDEDLLSKLTEPYVTTKKTGMGLGLSIVNKILEDHESLLDIRNTNNGVKVKFDLKMSKYHYM